MSKRTFTRQSPSDAGYTSDDGWRLGHVNGRWYLFDPNMNIVDEDSFRYDIAQRNNFDIKEEW